MRPKQYDGALETDTSDIESTDVAMTAAVMPVPLHEAPDESHGPDGSRGDVVVALRRQRETLARELAGVFPGEVPLELDAHTWVTLADNILAAIMFTVQAGSIEPSSGALQPIERLARSGVGARHIFACLHLAERMALGALREDPDFDDTPSTWNRVAEILRRASFGILAALYERLPQRPEAAIIRDPLTTLLIRPVFDLALVQEVVRAQRHRHPLSLLLFDLDELARINAKYGYGVGDRVVERLAILARRFFRTHDWLARHGDDSIAVLLPETTLDAAAELAERVRSMVEQRLAFLDHNTNAHVTVTLSAAAVGSDFVEDELDPYQVLAEAESAMRRAKMAGRNRVERAELQTTWVSLLGAASLLDSSPFAVRRLVRDGQLVVERQGRHYQISRASLERYRRGMSFEPRRDAS